MLEPVPPRHSRREYFIALKNSYWFHGNQMHRYAVCEPKELIHVGPDAWISPYAFGFHDYKDLEEHRQAYNIIYNGATCSWMFGYRLKVLLSPDAWHYTAQTWRPPEHITDFSSEVH